MTKEITMPQLALTLPIEIKMLSKTERSTGTLILTEKNITYKNPNNKTEDALLPWGILSHFSIFLDLFPLIGVK